MGWYSRDSLQFSLQDTTSPHNSITLPHTHPTPHVTTTLHTPPVPLSLHLPLQIVCPSYQGRHGPVYLSNLPPSATSRLVGTNWPVRPMVQSGLLY